MRPGTGTRDGTWRDSDEVAKLLDLGLPAEK